MKSLIIILSFIFFTSPLYAQELEKSACIGSWKVVNSYIIQEMTLGADAEGKKMMEQMRAGFTGAIFIFKENNECAIKFSDSMQEMMKEFGFLDSNKWKIEEGKKIAIGTEKDDYSIMFINVLIKEGKTYFILDESPFILEVVKQ